MSVAERVFPEALGLVVTATALAPQASALAPIPVEICWRNDGEVPVALHPWLPNVLYHAGRIVKLFLTPEEDYGPLILAAGMSHTRRYSMLLDLAYRPELEGSEALTLVGKCRLYTKPVEEEVVPDGGDYNLSPGQFTLDVTINRAGMAWLETDYGTRSAFFRYDGAIYCVEGRNGAALLEQADATDARAVTKGKLLSGKHLFHKSYSVKRAPKTELRGLSDVFLRAGDTIMSSYGNAKIADPARFEVLDTGLPTRFGDGDAWGYRCSYARDSTAAYYFSEDSSPAKANVVRACKSPETLRSLGFGYACDATMVFLEGRRIAKADGASFELLNGRFGRDRSGIWYGDKLLIFDDKSLTDVDVESFEVVPEPGTFRGPDAMTVSDWGRDKTGLMEHYGRATQADYDAQERRSLD